MSEFFSFLKTLMGCMTLGGIALLVLLALPKSRLRSVGLEFMKYAFAAIMFVLVPSPVDVMPDVVPGIGWVDDIGYIVAGISAIKSGRRDRKRRVFEEELDDAYRAKMAGIELSKPADDGRATGGGA